ncbi:MAG: VOC family protein [bacterium]|nr:VOC family protein [bacterium]
MAHKLWKWLGEDHITYVVRDIQAWRCVYMDVWGFKEIHHTADACPHGPSSMELYGLQAGRSRVALVSPINRTSISHVQTFLDVHGDHSVQHVAYAIQNLEAFVEEMKGRGFKFLGEIKQRSDAFGPIKQIFAKRFDARFTPGQGSFAEFVERPKKTRQKKILMTKRNVAGFFSSTVAGELYEDVEKDILNDVGDPFIAFPLIAA